MKWLDSVWFLLPVTGAALGCFFPLGKIAGEAGVPPLLWVAMISAGAAIVIGGIHFGRQQPAPLDRQHIRYFLITATISYAIPNVLVMLVIAHLGSGPTAIMYTLSPMVTALVARSVRLRAPSRLEYAGIAVGFLGALLVASARGEVGRPADWSYVVLGLLIPVSLALGNVYRSIDWPSGSAPTWLAFGSNAAAALLLAAIGTAAGESAQIGRIIELPAVAALQVAAAAVMFLFYFRLQRAGGPVTLSQIGTVAAAVGIVIGAGVLDEHYSIAAWAGVALIGCGLALTILARCHD